MVVLTSVFLANLLCSISPHCFPTYAPPTASEQVLKTRRGFDDEVDLWPIVNTIEGAVKGWPLTTVGGREVIAFEGVPFTEPPVGERRFRAPVRKRRWSGVLNADSRSNHCIQLDLSRFYSVTGNEDCLYLNVYTPAIPRNKSDSNLPVLVFFFGGAFFFGSKDQYGPAYLLDREVVLVTMNYRLGALGFLSTGNDASPGNFGLKDQLMGLEWVRDNINNFGGDPKKVTIMGESAGGASVHLHIMSKKSRGLFRAAISQSGTGLSPWSLLKNMPKTTFRYAQHLNCASVNSTEMVECLRSRSAQDITRNQLKLAEWLNHPIVNFAPIVEHNHTDAFLMESPRELYERGDIAQVPWIVGFVPDEGNIYNILMMLIPIGYYSFNRNFETLAPMTLSFRGQGLKEKELAKKIRKFYFGNQDITYKTMRSHSDMYGDRMLLSGIHDGMMEHARWAPTYGYYFNYPGKFSVMQRVGMTREEAGISHYDDVMYLFNSSSLHQSFSYTDADFDMVEFLTDLWSNFATYSEPLHTNNEGEETKVWSPLNVTRPQLLEITRSPKMIDFPPKFLKRIEFWKSLKIPE